MERLYCGDKDPLPPGYSGYASRYSCLRKGVGVGLYKIRQGQGNNNLPPPPAQATHLPWYRTIPTWAWILLFLLIVSFIIFIILYFTK